MKQEVKELWTAALRSGEYAQARQTLNSGDGFCCLGVLCDLHRQEVGGEWRVRGDDLFDSYLDTSACLPKEVAEWAGLEDESLIYGAGSPRPEYSPKVKRGPYLNNTLTELNDTRRLTFNQIADVIDKNF